MNASQQTTQSKNIPHVQGRTLLLAVLYSIGIGVLLGVITGFGLPLVVPALSDIDWLATIIATEVYLAFIVGHLIAFGGIGKMSRKLQLGHTSWRNIVLALALWLAYWAVLVATYLLLGSSQKIVGEMGTAVLKIGALYGRLDGASPELIIVAIIQPVFITPVAEEILFRGSLYGWLRGKLNAYLAILITATLFALYHPLIYLWPMAFLAGLISGWIRERTKSLTPFLVMHMLNSIALITISYFMTGWQV